MPSSVPAVIPSPWESVTIELVPDKPSGKASPKENDTFYLLAIGSDLFVVDVDAVKAVGRIAPKNEGFYGGESLSDYFKAEFEPQHAEIIRIQTKRKVPSGNLAPLTMIGDLWNASVTDLVKPVEQVSTDETAALSETIDRATEVMGSRDEAMRWLGTPVRALDFATPISLLGTKEGVELVNDVLGQMEHGIW